MEATAKLRFGTKVLQCSLNPLQAAEIAASKYGFFDLDVDSDDRGVKIKATAHRRTVTARGTNTEAAVERLLEIFTE